MRFKWIFWKCILSLTARYYGFPDPIKLIERLNRFAQPSEVFAPLELIRAGALFQARGLINSQVIQHNLDWIWPYWVERQFDPLDASFIPRAFSITHVNLTHRNWTATGLPGADKTVLVDPRGLVTPFYNSWSVDCWVIANGKPLIIPSRIKEVIQKNNYNNGHSIDTNFFSEGSQLQQNVSIEFDNEYSECSIDYRAQLNCNATVAITIRPYNPEGISFVHSIRSVCSGKGLFVDKKNLVYFDSIPESIAFSNFRLGDVFHRLKNSGADKKGIYCSAGMATAAALFPVRSGEVSKINVRIPLSTDKIFNCHKVSTIKSSSALWKNSLLDICKCEFPYKRYQELYDSAIHSLLLHSGDTIYAGPFTYKRFWFRDAAFILQALLFIGKTEYCRRIVESFFHWQKADGYFQSQEGEWDSNGQVLWSLLNYCEAATIPPPPHWLDSIRCGAAWIYSKRITRKSSPYFGLLPAGFSAEHLGPNDFYYWDDFWSIAGLFSAATLLHYSHQTQFSMDLKAKGESFFKSLFSNINNTVSKFSHKIIPASPNRRPDSGAVSSLVAAYPLQLLQPGDERITATSNYLFDNCCIDNAFYHDISHSGINPYLSLHIAQTFLRNGDERYALITDAINNLASATGQWPEAIHPQLGTGCMGDGQHIWAVAEWLMIIKNIFIREENKHNQVFLCSGIIREHLLSSKRCSLGPVYSRYGIFNIAIEVHHDYVEVIHTCTPNLRERPEVFVSLCGLKPVPVTLEGSQTRFSLTDIDL
jgi:hypothetical protein